MLGHVDTNLSLLYSYRCWSSARLILMLLNRCASVVASIVTSITALLLCGSVAADIKGVESEQRARINYMLNCQGCHGPDGAGTRDGVVPLMVGVMRLISEP